MDNEFYENLANAIVQQAVDDYRAAIRGMYSDGVVGHTNKWCIADVERFMHSDWYALLTKLDPNIILKKLWQEYYEGLRLVKEGNRILITTPKKHYRYTCPLCGGKAEVWITKKPARKNYRCEDCKTTEARFY